MSKLSIDVVKKMRETNCTSKEIQFMLFLAQYQCSDDICHGIYYKDAMAEVPCCKQTFYEIMKSLKAKGIISVTRESTVDYDITIIGNTSDKLVNRYLSVRKPILHTAAFKEMPAMAKMIALDLIINVGATKGHVWQIGKDKFKEDYFDNDFLPVKIEWKTFLSYIREIKKIIMLKPAFDSKKNIKYVVKQKPDTSSRPHNDKSNTTLWTHYFLVRLCRRLKFPYINHNKLSQAAEFLPQYFYIARGFGKDICDVFKWAFFSSVEKEQKLTINPALIHKYIRLNLFNEPLLF